MVILNLSIYNFNLNFSNPSRIIAEIYCILKLFAKNSARDQRRIPIYKQKQQDPEIEEKRKNPWKKSLEKILGKNPWKKSFWKKSLEQTSPTKCPRTKTTKSEQEKTTS